MTRSKERLERFVKIYKDYPHVVWLNLNANDLIDILEDAIKELEVLEILKRIDWLVYNNGDKNDFNWYIDTNKSMKITEEVGKIKEWLNDK